MLRSREVKIRHEISFNDHLYQPNPMRPLAQIRTDILALACEREALLSGIAGGAVDAERTGQFRAGDTEEAVEYIDQHCAAGRH